MVRFAMTAGLLAGLAGAAGPGGGNLQETLAKLDAASARFTSAEAKVHRESYLAILKSVDSTQDGSLYVMRGKDGKTQVGLRTEGQGARTVEYRNGVVRDYNPVANCYDTVNKPGIDTYLSLGFGGSGKDLARAWEITDLGPETIDGTKTEKLDLVPRDAGVKANVQRVTVWIDLDEDVTRKLIFFSPSGDRNTATYSEIRVGKPVKVGDYAIKGKPC